MLFSVVVSVFLGAPGDYSFAVRLVNLMNTVGWAYYKGIAVITLSDSKLVFVDTRSKEIYFTLGGSIHQFVKHHEIRDPFKLSVFSRINLEELFPGEVNKKKLKLEIIVGFIEAPSPSNANELIRYSGKLLKAKLNSWCILKLSECISKIMETVEKLHSS